MTTGGRGGDTDDGGVIDPFVGDAEGVTAAPTAEDVAETLEAAAAASGRAAVSEPVPDASKLVAGAEEAGGASRTA